MWFITDSTAPGAMPRTPRRVRRPHIQNSSELFHRDVAPAEDHPDPFALPFGTSSDRAGDGRRACSLRHLMRRLQQQADRGDQLRITDQHDLVDESRQQLHRQVEGLAGREPFGEGRDGFQHDPSSRRPGLVEGRRPFRLHADDARRRVDRPRHDRRAEDSAPGTDGDEQDVQVRDDLEQFQCIGRHPGDQQRLVGRMDIAQALSARMRLGGEARASKSCPIWTTSAPRARVAATFSGLAPSGM